MTDNQAEKPAERSDKMTIEKGLALLVAAVVVGTFAVLLIQAIILR